MGMQMVTKYAWIEVDHILANCAQPDMMQEPTWQHLRKSRKGGDAVGAMEHAVALDMVTKDMQPIADFTPILGAKSSSSGGESGFGGEITVGGTTAQQVQEVVQPDELALCGENEK